MKSATLCVAISTLFVNFRYQLSFNMDILYHFIKFQFLFIIIHTLGVCTRDCEKLSVVLCAYAERMLYSRMSLGLLVFPLLKLKET